MKKRIKLFIAIASICLSIAVFCFGVFSATQVSYSIGGSISYEVNDVFVKINTRIYSTPNQKTESEMNTDITTLASKTFTQIEAITDYTLTQTMVEYTSNGAESSNTHTAKDSSNNGAKIDYKENAYTYYIVINVENLSPSKSVYAYLSEDISLSSNANTIFATNNKQNAIAKGETTKNIVIGFSLKDKRTSIPSDITFTSNIIVDYVGKITVEKFLGFYADFDEETKTATIQAYDEEAFGEDVVIPEKVSKSSNDEYQCIEGNDYTVTVIGERAFDSYSITSVIIPNTITRIEDDAFQGCMLTTVTIPSSVIYLGEFVFVYCDNLESIIFEDTSNWFVYNDYDATVGTSVSVGNTSNNATLLTDTYASYIWKKS